MLNGVIFQSKEDRTYQGVEGNNWYLSDLYPELEDFYKEIDEESCYNTDFVAVCSQMDIITKYVELSKLNNIKFRILLCETEQNTPVFQKTDWETKFIGYDYAYSGGDYYSAVWSDVCTGRIERFRKYRLNNYGLFETFTEITDYVHSRQCYEKELLAKDKMDMTLEKGDFIIYKLYEIVLNESFYRSVMNEG